jgi:hypothetical protein
MANLKSYFPLARIHHMPRHNFSMMPSNHILRMRDIKETKRHWRYLEKCNIINGTISRNIRKQHK